MVIGAVSCIPATESGYGGRETQRVGCAGVHPHPVPPDAHLHRVHGGIPSEVCIRRPADRLAVTAKKGGTP